jgi:hypothetical protein
MTYFVRYHFIRLVMKNGTPLPLTQARYASCTVPPRTWLRTPVGLMKALPLPKVNKSQTASGHGNRVDICKGVSTSMDA